MDAASQLDALRDRLWPPLLAKRLDKELRGVAERAVSLPEAHALKRRAVRHRTVMELESAAPCCARCGKPVVLRETAGGSFWGCSAFPRCFCSRPLTQDERKALENVE
jgi:hypothetical protein